ncbi:hypothetical protein [Oryza sativa Japonica Group]|uniref:Uncharacterized protein n=1 Tax=Oryza sativa subsp. japonica TaxID=39947 RepID=Q5ZCX1_ORYSJ|nr:hypothetical protein [Oryza sativa Japonica Group]
MMSPIGSFSSNWRVPGKTSQATFWPSPSAPSRVPPVAGAPSCRLPEEPRRRCSLPPAAPSAGRRSVGISPPTPRLPLLPPGCAAAPVVAAPRPAGRPVSQFPLARGRPIHPGWIWAVHVALPEPLGVAAPVASRRHHLVLPVPRGHHVVRPPASRAWTESTIAVARKRVQKIVVKKQGKSHIPLEHVDPN